MAIRTGFAALILVFFTSSTWGQMVAHVQQELLMLGKQWNECKIAVFKSHDGKIDKEEVLGRVTQTDKGVAFSPFIPFTFGQEYAVQCKDQVEYFQVPIPESYVFAEIAHVFPSTGELPANLLKFNLHFSSPMSKIAYPYISLLDSSGHQIERAFLLDIPELWNDDFTELSLWIEPGRIKRGLGPNVKLGPVLEEGKSYQLVIDSSLRDVNGVPMLDSYKLNFTVSEEDRVKPDAAHWLIKQEIVQGKVGIRILFDEMMDAASAENAFSIEGVEGDWELANDSRSIVFRPTFSLKKGGYTIAVNPKIEDLAGNNLIRLFDENLHRPTDHDVTSELYFSIH